MTESTDKADLPLLLATVATSQIVVPALKARDFADWCRLQQPADIDTVILNWLRSHGPQPALA
jgi:hypothetical protein